MRRYRIIGVPVILLAALVIMVTAGCFGSTTTPPASVTPAVLKPTPRVESVVATTSGTQTAYYATLDIKVKNDGAEGTILVRGTVTQAGQSSQNEMPVFLKQGESHELKLTFPLVWEGGSFTTDVRTIVP